MIQLSSSIYSTDGLGCRQKGALVLPAVRRLGLPAEGGLGLPAEGGLGLPAEGGLFLIYLMIAPVWLSIYWLLGMETSSGLLTIAVKPQGKYFVFIFFIDFSYLIIYLLITRHVVEFRPFNNCCKTTRQVFCFHFIYWLLLSDYLFTDY